MHSARLAYHISAPSRIPGLTVKKGGEEQSLKFLSAAHAHVVLGDLDLARGRDLSVFEQLANKLVKISLPDVVFAC
eukprot:587452-Hanusia_phi.AAC.5